MERTRPHRSDLDQFAGIERLRRLPLDGLLVAELDLDVIGFLYWFRHRRPFFDPEVEEYASIQELHVFEGFRELFRDVHYKLRL
jgi:hypothetical protein